MYMNLKSNKHKIISFNTTTMASSAFIGPAKISGPPLNLAPPTPNYIFCSAPPRPQLFWPEIFRSPLKIRGGGAATMSNFAQILNSFIRKLTS